MINSLINKKIGDISKRSNINMSAIGNNLGNTQRNTISPNYNLLGGNPKPSAVKTGKKTATKHNKKRMKSMKVHKSPHSSVMSKSLRTQGMVSAFSPFTNPETSVQRIKYLLSSR
jgi:hypothetical protein